MLALSIRDSDFEDSGIDDTDDVDFDDVATADVDLLGALITEAVIAVPEDFPLDELIGMVVHRRANAIVVVDAARRVRGVIAPHDLLEGATHSKRMTAADVMIAAFVLGADTSIACAAAVMAYEGVDQIVVADARGQLLFVVTARDIARQVASRAGYVGLKRAG